MKQCPWEKVGYIKDALRHLGLDYMNIDKILSDEYYTFLEDNHNVAFYSLAIGLEEYFETYHQVCVYLSKYERDNKEKINYDIVTIGLHFFLKDVRPMLPPVMNRSIVDA